MSTILKLVILVIVIVIAVAGIWWWHSSSSQKQTTNTASNLKTTQSVQINAVTSPNDASDAGLSNDLSAIDNQINGLNTDSANVDQSLNQ